MAKNVVTSNGKARSILSYIIGGFSVTAITVLAIYTIV